eukprot:gene7806-biopygen14357
MSRGGHDRDRAGIEATNPRDRQLRF